ncbi:MAG: (2Fe-2S)-binding protein [Firmicutes bacterium]|nr:(2Fe-2S)-binding protein [Bacillota bacterium]
MDMKAVGDDFKVCLCKQKTKKEIMDLIRENHITDLKTLKEEGDVGNKCGACGEDLQQLLDMVNGEEEAPEA